MIVRIHNNNSTDYVDIEWDNIDDIREQAKDRVKLPWRDSWWSENL